MVTDNPITIHFILAPRHCPSTLPSVESPPFYLHLQELRQSNVHCHPCSVSNADIEPSRSTGTSLAAPFLPSFAT